MTLCGRFIETIARRSARRGRPRRFGIAPLPTQTMHRHWPVAVGESLEHLRPCDAVGSRWSRRRCEARGAPQTWDTTGRRARSTPIGMFRGTVFVGGARLMRRIAKNWAEIGYWVHPAFTGRGFATRCCASAHDARTEPSRSDPYPRFITTRRTWRAVVFLQAGFRDGGEQAVKVAGAWRDRSQLCLEDGSASWAAKAWVRSRARNHNREAGVSPT